MAATTDDGPNVDVERQAQENGPASIRENLVATAVTFLQNPKVRQSPFAQRKGFLERKGLTPQEIAVAVERSGTASDEHLTPSGPPSSNAVVPARPSAPAPVVPQVSMWTKIREATTSVVLISGAGYGLYHVYQVYLAPLLFGKRRKEEEQFDKLTKSVDELRKTMVEVATSIIDLQRQTANSHDQVVAVIRNNSFSRVNEDLGLSNVSDLKDELKSVKTLLLSKSQFPPAPVVAPVLPPSWQLKRTSAEVAKQPEDAASQIESSSSVTQEEVISPPVTSNETADHGVASETDQGDVLANGEVQMTSADGAATNSLSPQNGSIHVEDSFSESLGSKNEDSVESVSQNNSNTD